MTKAPLLLVITLLVFQVSASDATFNRLQKLYESDPAECLILAKKYMKRHPAKASPYYFAAIVFKDKVERARNTRGKYFHMNKALGFAKSFIELEDFEIQEMVDWKVKAVEFDETARQVIQELLDSEDSDLGFRLEMKLNKYGFNETIMIAGNDTGTSSGLDEIAVLETTTASPTLSLSSAPEIVKITGQFYGMPSGTEIVKSYNLTSEQELLKLINAERKKQGMVELVWEEDLARACRYHAFDQGTQGYFNHDSYDRSGDDLVNVGGTFSRIKKFYKGSFVNSENIAAGNESAAGTYEQWYNSPGHYENMFNKASTKVGIGVYQVPGSTYEYYWVFCTALPN
jgi:uncharacterized protein YkwD